MSARGGHTERERIVKWFQEASNEEGTVVILYCNA